MSVSSFSNFVDGNKFKYTDDGNIALNYDNSTWRNVLLNNMLLEDYVNSQYITPTIQSKPVYDMNINKKIQKYNKFDERINNKKCNKNINKNSICKNDCKCNNDENLNIDDISKNENYIIKDNFYVNINGFNKDKIKINKSRFSRKKNIEGVKKEIRLNKIFDNYDYYNNDIDDVIWIKSYCERCGENEKTNKDNLCVFCEYYIEYIKDIYDTCPGCKTYNGTGDLCIFCRLYD